MACALIWLKKRPPGADNCLFGFESGPALATAVGLLVEMPVMPLVVHLVNASSRWNVTKP